MCGQFFIPLHTLILHCNKNQVCNGLHSVKDHMKIKDYMYTIHCQTAVMRIFFWCPQWINFHLTSRTCSEVTAYYCTTKYVLITCDLASVNCMSWYVTPTSKRQQWFTRALPTNTPQPDRQLPFWIECTAKFPRFYTLEDFILTHPTHTYMNEFMIIIHNIKWVWKVLY